MNSIITIQPCKFTNYPQQNVITGLIEDNISYGYRCYDDYDRIYCDLWEEKDMDLSSIETLEKVYNERKDNEVLTLMFNFIIANELGIFVGDAWLEWIQIRRVLT